jgi:hypothetical protein
MLNEMGDCMPPHFLGHLRSFAPDVPDDFIRSIRSGQLPPNIQAIHVPLCGPHLRGRFPASTREHCPTQRQHRTSAVYRGCLPSDGSTQCRSGLHSLLHQAASVKLQEPPPEPQIPLPRWHCTQPCWSLRNFINLTL